MTKEYRVEIKVKNNVFMRKIEIAGYKTLGEFCRKNNLPPSDLGDFINLKKSPLNKKGDFFKSILDTAYILKCSPEDLFSESQLYTALKTNKKTIEIEEAEMKFMIQNEAPLSIEHLVEKEQKDILFNNMLDTLTPREQKIISLSFGLEGKEYSLREIGETLDISNARVRQIQKNALRKMRHPYRSAEIREFLD